METTKPIEKYDSTSKIILLSGRKGVGKDCTAEYLREQYEDRGFKVFRVAFADKLKLCVASLFGWDIKKMAGSTDEDREWREQPDNDWSAFFGKQTTPRSMLQIIGTELFRQNLNVNFWVYTTIKHIKTLIDNVKSSNLNQRVVIIVSDARFMNELQIIPEYFVNVKHIHIIGNRNPTPIVDNIRTTITQTIEASYNEDEKSYNTAKYSLAVSSIKRMLFNVLGQIEHSSEIEPSMYEFIEPIPGKIQLTNNYETVEEYYNHLSEQNLLDQLADLD